MDFTKLKNCMDMFTKKYSVPGLDCIVYKNHEQLFRYFTGYSDMENGKKMKGDELYLIFSMTKMLTCTAALQLLEQGKYTLSDPISMYLPEFEKMRISDSEIKADADKITSGTTEGETVTGEISGYAKNPITVKDLFTMGAGLDYDINAEGIKKALNEGKRTTREIVGALSETVLGFEPGTRFRYSLCHDVLGALVEIWSGKKFGEYLKENIFEPVGMENTFFGMPRTEEGMERMAARYRYEDGKPVRTELLCPYNIPDHANITTDYESGGAGLISCTEDYALFLDAMACGGMARSGKRILSPNTVELMGTNHLTGKALEDFDAMRSGYGYGLGVRTHIDKAKSGSLSPLGEFGWDGAAGAFAMVDPINKISFTYFQHVMGWDKRIQTEMRNALYASLD